MENNIRGVRQALEVTQQAVQNPITLEPRPGDETREITVFFRCPDVDPIMHSPKIGCSFCSQ